MPEADLPSEERRARAVVRRLGERYGTRAQSAIRFALANPDISCVVVGLAELSHLEEALAAAEMGPLPDDALAALREVYARRVRRRLRRRRRLGLTGRSRRGRASAPASERSPCLSGS